MVKRPKRWVETGRGVGRVSSALSKENNSKLFTHIKYIRGEVQVGVRYGRGARGGIWPPEGKTAKIQVVLSLGRLTF